MTLRTRIAILVACFTLFLATAPVVVLYTAGYRYNAKKQAIEKVGILFIRSRPEGATIWLNEEKRRERSPSRLRNLLPGTYTVTVGREGYVAWSKRLPVESERTTFAEGIVLFLDRASEPGDLSTLSDEERAQLSRTDPRRSTHQDETVATDGFELWVERADGSREVITRVGEEIVAVLPYPAGPYLLYQTAREVHAVERDGRDGRNDTVLASGTGMRGMTVDARGSVLHFKTEKDGVTVLNKRQLQ